MATVGSIPTAVSAATAGATIAAAVAVDESGVSQLAAENSRFRFSQVFAKKLKGARISRPC